MRETDPFTRQVVSYSHSKEELEQVAHVKGLFRPQDEARAVLERQWQVNTAFYNGQQWTEWNNARWALTPIPTGNRKQIRDQRNFLRPHVERSVAILTSYAPEFRVRPATRDIEDEQAALVSTKVCNGYWGRCGMPLKSQMLGTYMSVMGTGFLKAGWNASAGKSFHGPLLDEETGEFMYHEETGEPLISMYYEGDFSTSVISPDHLFVDPFATCDEDVEWMMECVNVPIEWVERAYPERARFVADVIDYEREAQGSNIERIHHGWGSLAGTQGEADGWVTKYEFYRRPSPKYPEGQKIVIAGDFLLELGDNPCYEKSFPYIAFRKLVVPGSYWGATELSDMVTPQRNYNRISSKILEHSFLYGLNMKLDWPGTAGDPQTEFMAGVGEILKRRGNQAPSYLQIPNLPSDAKEQAETIRRDMDDISGVYSVEKGQFPGKASGVAMDLLVEQGTSKNRPVIQRMVSGYERWGRMLLHDMQRYATEERMVKIQGRHEQVDIQSFTGADLEGADDVTIEIGTMMPKSRRMALTELVEMAQSGLLNMQDPAHRARAFKSIQMEDPSIFSYDHVQDRREAQQEDQAAKRGEPVMPHQVWQSLDVHVQQHFETLRSDDFKTWHPEAQRILLDHVQDTLQKSLPVAGATVSPDQMQPAPAGQEE